MSFQPVVPAGAYSGWTFLRRTLVEQKAAFAASAEMQRDEAYFRAKIGSVSTAEDLVEDRRLLKVALGAYGLDADIDAKYFIRRVLEEGTLQEGALSLRLADTHYREFAAGFGFGDYAVPNAKLSDFADDLLSAYETRQFEAAVGNRSDTMRLALNAEREVAALAGRSTSEDAKWYSVMASEPLRAVFQGALGLPSSLAAIDIDQQLGVFKQKASSCFGNDTVSQFAEPDALEKLIRTYLLRSEAVAVSPLAQGANALQLLQSTAQGAASTILSLL